MKKNILVLFVHPAIQKSRVNVHLLNAIENLDGVTIRKLYDVYPDFMIDVKHEQNLLLEHDLIVWHHPFYWYGAPSLLKEWIDLVLEHNFAYGKKGTNLKGKEVMTVITTGGRREAYEEKGYNNFTIGRFLTPFEQTAKLCYMNYLPPFVVHGTHLLSEKDIFERSQEYKNILIALRDGYLGPDDISTKIYMNDILA